jgi:uncharacterized protein (DUF1800 family)
MLKGLRRIAAVLALATVAACGGGGGGGGGGATGGGSGGGGGGSPPPTIPESARFLTQASFGPTEAAINDVRQRGFTDWVNQQLAAPQQSRTHLAFVDERLTELRAVNAGANLSANQFYESFWLNAATGSDQLRQRVKFAYSQIFVISLNDPNIDVRGAASYYDMLGQNAFGTYRNLLERITLHPMMGRYLTYMANQKEDPNGTRTPDENYAREVLQLFSIGLVMLNADGSPQLDANGRPVPSYTQADISGLAKVFTGISWYHPTPTNSTFFGNNRDPEASVRPMIFYPQYHSTSEKRFLGTTIEASATVDVAGGLRRALDTIANHPNVGPFIATRLIQQLVTSNPSPGYVQRVATVFNNNGQGVRGDMAAVIRAVLLDAEARDMANASSQTFGKLREPVIRLATWMRAFGATSQSGDWLISSTSANTSLAQSPLASPSVFNFWRPGYVPPNTTLGARSLLAPEFQSVDEVTVAGYVNTMQNVVNNGIGSTPPGGSGNDVRSSYAAEIAVANDAAALTERMNTLLLYGQMSPTLRTRIQEAVTAIAVPAAGSSQAQIDAALLNRAKIAVFLTLISPEFLAQR